MLKPYVVVSVVTAAAFVNHFRLSQLFRHAEAALF